jgi:elongation factor P--beta-lysine ligase
MKTKKEIEQLAEKFYNKSTSDFEIYLLNIGFVDGYNQCQEDNKDKKYTEKDMMKAFEYGKTLQPFDCFEDFINSLNKQD